MKSASNLSGVVMMKKTPDREIEKWVTVKGRRIPIYKDAGEPEDYDHATQMKSIRKWVRDFDKVTAQDKKVIESFIYWDVKRGRGPISSRLSRGISLSKEDFDNLEVGNEWAEGKLASWSTSIGMATAHSKHNTSDKKPYPVVFRLNTGTSQAAKLTGAYGDYDYKEGEAIMSSKAKFVIVKIKKPRNPLGGGITEVIVEEKK